MSLEIKGSLILLRGLPGSGKSTLAALLSSEGKHPCFSIDDYFTDKESGAYQFKFDENHLAYKVCEENVENSMINGEEKIFVHNTFTMEWEMEPYFLLAIKHNYKVFVFTVENRHKSKNIHGVKEEQIIKMAEKYKVELY
jgi:predicted kinase